MNRQASITLLIVLVAFCFSMTTAQDFKRFPNKLQRDFDVLVRKFLEKVKGTFTPEEINEIEELANTEDVLVRIVADFFKKKTPEQRKKFMEEVDWFENRMHADIRKYYKPTLDGFRKEMEKMDEKKGEETKDTEKKEEEKKEGDKKDDEKNGAEVFSTFGVIAIVAALNVF